VFKGIPNALSNMNRLAGVTDTLADAFTKLTTVLNKLLNLIGLGEKEPEKPKEMTKAEAAAAEATAAQRGAAKPLEERVDTLAKQLDADEKALKDAKRAGKFGDDLKVLEDRILKNKKEYEQATSELIANEEKIKQAALEERRIRLEQMQDRKLLQRLENENLKDAEEIAKLNEKKADAIKAGKSTKAIEEAIAELKTGVAARTPQVAKLQEKLKTSPNAAAGAAAPPAPGAPAVPGGSAPAGAPGAPSGPKPEEVLKFTGASGGRENFEGLSQGLKNKLLAAGQQYLEQTGHRLQMNSGFRSAEDQQRLYDKTVKAGTPGKDPNTGFPVAPPGRSAHESGNAVDIQNFGDPRAFAALTANGLRQTVPKDPVHFEIQAHDGGVFSGPDEGYPAQLHGDEAVIPLNNGGGNFVKVFEDMAMMMGKQVSAIDELIRIAKNGNDIQTKILRIQS